MKLQNEVTKLWRCLAVGGCERTGETLFIHLAKLAEVWPQSAEVQVGPVRLVMADYRVWKDKVRRKQMQGGNE